MIRVLSAGHEFVFVTHYPASVRPFCHMRLADRPDLTDALSTRPNDLSPR